MQSRLKLEQLKIAAPCEVSWESMQGNDRVRFCKECQLNVYNLSGMTRRAAEALINEREGRICVSILRRADGTMLTRDCPIGLRAIRRRMARMAASAAALAAFLLAGVIGLTSKGSTKGANGRPSVLERFTDWLDARGTPPPKCDPEETEPGFFRTGGEPADYLVEQTSRDDEIADLDAHEPDEKSTLERVNDWLNAQAKALSNQDFNNDDNVERMSGPGKWRAPRDEN